jgi:hypothetical protein
LGNINSEIMKTLLTLIALATTSFSAHAGQIIPPATLIKQWARTMYRASYTPVLGGIDYAKIVKQNPIWTKEAVNNLFASIDPEKVKFADLDSLGSVIIMEEPIKIKFTFGVSNHETSVPNRVTTFYGLVGIERIEEKKAQQDGGGQPSTRPESK